MKISAFINTLNEAKRIRHCLESLKWADELVVVDMHSDDDTVKIAREYTGKVFLFERVGFCEPARKFAAEQTTGDWIVNLDADELITLSLRQELLRIVKENKYDAVYVPRKNFFWGEHLQHGGCGLLQDRPLRFFKRDAVVFSDKIHAGIHLKEGARVYHIDNPKAHIVHFSYLSVEQYWQKLDRYTSIEAKALYESGKGYTFKDARKDIWAAFFKRYFKKSQGYKDGQWGLIYCLWTAVYKLNTYAKYLLMKKHGRVDYVPAIEQEYERIAQETLTQLKEGK